MSDFAVQTWPPPRAGLALAAVALVCGFGASCAFAVAGIAWARAAPEPQVAAIAAAPPIAAPPHWLDVIRPVQIFSFEARQFQREPLAYAARRLVSGGTREDTLAYGTPSGEAPMLRLALLRGAMADEGLQAGLSRLAERQHVAVSLGVRRGALTTRFGRFETATLHIPGALRPAMAFILRSRRPASRSTELPAARRVPTSPV